MSSSASAGIATNSRTFLTNAAARAGSDCSAWTQAVNSMRASSGVVATARRRGAQGRDSTTATAMYREMDMWFYLEQAEAEMRELP